MLNLTQHTPTDDQIAAGVIEPKDKQVVVNLLTFGSLPSQEEVSNSAKELAKIAQAEGAKEAMIGGAPFLMYHLHKALLEVGIKPQYAFSLRESVETVLEDGSVSKTAIFQHKGFV